MSDSIRSFIAVKIPLLDPLRPVLRELAEMGRALKSVDPENLHVTLKFLGNISSESISEVRSALEGAAATGCRCVVRLTGLGVFPHPQRPSVVWAGLEGADNLSAVAGEIDRRLEALGFLPEERPFAPHLTLARVKAKPPQELHALLARHAKTAFGTAAIDHVDLFRSDLGPDGPKYTVLATAQLKG
jgi:RNA 2',3'-cyclic 3'-phosphodiesterase